MIREVNPDELMGYVHFSDYLKPIWLGAIYEGEEIVGHGCVSTLHGKAWAHDLKHWGTDKHAVAELYQAAIEGAKEKGVKEIYTDVSDEKMMRIYERMGWQRVSVVYRGEL